MTLLFPWKMVPKAAKRHRILPKMCRKLLGFVRFFLTETCENKTVYMGGTVDAQQMSESFFSFCRGCVFHSLRYIATNPCSTHGKLGNLVSAKLRFFPKMPNDSPEKATMFCIFIHFEEGYAPRNPSLQKWDTSLRTPKGHISFYSSFMTNNICIIHCAFTVHPLCHPCTPSCFRTSR